MFSEIRKWKLGDWGISSAGFFIESVLFRAAVIKAGVRFTGVQRAGLIHKMYP